MKVVYSRLAMATSPDNPNYWDYFGTRLVDLAEISEGAAVLDIGTGPGSVLIPVVEKAGEHGLGVGIDFDFGWFKHILPEIHKRRLGNMALAQMDVANLGFMNGLFDRALCGFVGWDYCFDFFKMEFFYRV